jgi:hypothetical protein
MMVSRELIVDEDGQHFIIAGNPAEGYVLAQVVECQTIGHFRRKWQAVEASRQVPAAS